MEKRLLWKTFITVSYYGTKYSWPQTREASVPSQHFHFKPEKPKSVNTSIDWLLGNFSIETLARSVAVINGGCGALCARHRVGSHIDAVEWPGRRFYLRTPPQIHCCGLLAKVSKHRLLYLLQLSVAVYRDPKWWMNVCMYVHIYTYIYMFIHIYIYIYILCERTEGRG